MNRFLYSTSTCIYQAIFGQLPGHIVDNDDKIDLVFCPYWINGLDSSR